MTYVGTREPPLCVRTRWEALDIGSDGHSDLCDAGGMTQSDVRLFDGQNGSNRVFGLDACSWESERHLVVILER